ncbi:MAG: hypothetical protein HY323_05595 [Betaproteobacteria bacterium]|nr:hypothetical protein [Betaproteobacteria bacterium]
MARHELTFYSAEIELPQGEPLFLPIAARDQLAALVTLRFLHMLHGWNLRIRTGAE